MFIFTYFKIYLYHSQCFIPPKQIIEQAKW